MATFNTDTERDLEVAALAGKRVGIAGFPKEQAAAIRETLESAQALCRILATVDDASLLSLDLALLQIDAETNRQWLEEHSSTLKVPILSVGEAGTVLQTMPALQKTGGDFLVGSNWTQQELLLRTVRMAWKGNPAAESPVRAHPIVLIVDDDNAVISLLSNVLKKAGFECHAARDGGAGVDMAKQLRPDLMIIDVNMPNRDGFEVLQLLRQSPETAEVRTVLLTACEQEADMLRGFGLGADDYVIKPFNPMEISARVKSVLRRSR